MICCACIIFTVLIRNLTYEVGGAMMLTLDSGINFDDVMCVGSYGF